MKRWLKWLLILGIPAILIAVAVPTAAWWQERSVPKFLTVEVSRGRVETAVNSTGTVKPVRTVSVGAFISGPVKEVKVDFNSVVKKGDELAIIDPDLLKAAVVRDRATLETQKADKARIEALLQQAVNNENRAIALQKVNRDYISDTEMDQFIFAKRALDAQLKLACASIKQADANLKNSKTNLNYTRILAPEDGIVIDRKVDKGQTVAASFQTPELFIIAPEMDKHMFVFASVDEADIGMIAAAKSRKQAVKFTVDAYPGHLFDGLIDQIRMNSTTTQNVVTYPVIIDAPNIDQKLKPGMTANITFQIEAKEDVLRVPAVALRFTPLLAHVHPEDRHYLEALTAVQSVSSVKRSANEKASMAQGRQRRIVWIKDGPLLRAVPVTLGLIENQFAEVISGDLREGQAIVTGVEGALAPR